MSAQNLDDLLPLIPTVAVGHHVWLTLELTWRGAVVKAQIYDGGGLEDIDDDRAEGHSVDPRKAARLVQFLEGFQCEGLRHLSVQATHAMHDAEAPDLAEGGEATAATHKAATSEAATSEEATAKPATSDAPPPIPVQRANDDALLQV